VPTESGREGEFEQLTRAEDEEDSLAVVQRPNVTAIMLTKGLQVADDVIDHFSNADYFIRTYLKFMHKMGAVMAQYEEAYTELQNEAQLFEHYLFLQYVFYLPPPASVLFPITLTSFCKDH
jgi:hypothetical protein